MPDSVVSAEGPILASSTPPESTAYYQRWLDTSTGNAGSGRLHHYVGGEWVVVGDDLVTGTFEGGIKKIKVVNGLVTEVEVDGG